MAVQVPDLDAFSISTKLGFLSKSSPLTSFCGTRYARWDELVAQLPRLVSSHSLRQEIDVLPYIDPTALLSNPELERAYVVLAFLVHAYVWGDSSGSRPIEAIPPQLAEPFLHVCDKVGMEPVLGYAGLCLWNWKAKGGKGARQHGFFELDELESVGSFTGTRGEDAFYHVPVLVEAEGGPLVSVLLGAVAAAQRGDTEFVRAALIRSTETIGRMKKHLPKLYSTLNASMFYHELRPFLGGGKGMEEKGLARGFVFQRRDGSEKMVKCIGGSAAQSSLFQFLDLVLGVEHESPSDSSESFFQTMRLYMPGRHREFLQAVSELPTIRSFVEQHALNKSLTIAFDDCIKQIRQWRSLHIAVVSKYIVRPARLAEKGQSDAGPPDAGAANFGAAEGENLKGTGGSALIPFLKQARDETAGVKGNDGGL